MRVLLQSLESEHVFLSGGYLSAGLVGHESPWVMGVAYLAVGTMHAHHVVRSRKRKTPSED
jgi:hypothetical protein